MIDRSILRGLQFRECDESSGWDHEVWYHKSDYWIHYGLSTEERSKLFLFHERDGDTCDQEEFLTVFLRHYGEKIMESASISFPSLCNTSTSSSFLVK